MTFLEWGPGSIKDSNRDGNLEVKQKDVRLFGMKFLTLPDIDVVLPTAVVVKTVKAAAEHLPFDGAQRFKELTERFLG